MGALGAQQAMPLMIIIAQCSGIAAAAAKNFLLPQKKKNGAGCPSRLAQGDGEGHAR
jgi:hypothetical protein